MSITGVIISAALVGGTGLLIGVFLGIASRTFAVSVDQKELDVRAELPGNNCGGCGYPGCDGLAKAIANKEAPPSGCPVGGEPVAKKIAAIMGEEIGESTRMTAFVHCSGDCEKTHDNYEYSGVDDCNMLLYVPSRGPKSCHDGCCGYGSCVKACPFDAIHIVQGIALVDKEACKACGKCVKTCPKSLISLVPYDATVHVACSTKEKGKTVMDSCEVGCISCKKCEKNCPAGAIVLEGNTPVIDYSACTSCGTCKEECPRGCIIG